MHFRIGGSEITHEQFEDEVVIVDLVTGSYYSAEATAARIWELALAGLSEEEVIERIQLEYAETPEKIAKSTATFLDELVKQGLLSRDETESLARPARDLAPSAEKRQFQAPYLEKYTDMEELLAIDPVHEVEETGWPRKKQE